MRIIAGKHKGLNLKTFEADNIRPTADRVREGIFNKLQFNIKGARVLDLFGGTGAIGLEFLSRGALEVIVCDNNKNSINLIRENYLKAKEKPNLICNDYKSALSSLKGENFDIIFLDPPFATNFGEIAINMIFELSLLDDDGIIVFEHGIEKEYLTDKFEIIDNKKYGTIMVTYLKGKDV